MISRLARVLADPGPLRRCLAGFGVGAVLQGVGFVLLVPVLDALLDGDTSRAWRWTALMAFVLGAYAAVRYWSQLAAYHTAIGLSRNLFHRIGDHITGLPLGWFSSDRVGRVGRLSSQGVIDVMGVPAHLLRPLVNAVVTPITVVTLMAMFDWRLALAAAATAPVAFVVQRWSAGLVQRAEHATDAAAAESATRLVEFAQTQAVLRAFGRSSDGHDLLEQALVDQHAAGRRLLRTAVPGLIAFRATIQAAFTVVLIVGVNRALGGSTEPAELIALLVLAVRFVEPMVTIADIAGGLRIALNSLDRIDTLLATAPLPEPAQPHEPAGAGIELDHVGFGYQDVPVLTDCSLHIPAGSFTAIVGPSGSGKTTITRLIARFWDVDTGTVRIGGTDVRDMTTQSLMAQVAPVFQDTYLFAGTIADNLRLARPDATDSDLEHVAALARLDDVIARLPDRWDTQVGESGSALSGGERQRVAIARALLKQAPIVLLDEATAAIDPENEAAVQNALDTLRGTTTLVVIAHRLQTIATADQIAVLEHGHIAESGTHRELLAHNGRYAAFWNERRRAHGWRITPTTTLTGEP